MLAQLLDMLSPLDPVVTQDYRRKLANLLQSNSKDTNILGYHEKAKTRSRII